jgi:hypothetical protein
MNRMDSGTWILEHGFWNMDSGTWNPPQLRENFEQQDICFEQIALIDQFADQPNSLINLIPRRQTFPPQFA